MANYNGPAADDLVHGYNLLHFITNHCSCWNVQSFTDKFFETFRRFSLTQNHDLEEKLRAAGTVLVQDDRNATHLFYMLDSIQFFYKRWFRNSQHTPPICRCEWKNVYDPNCAYCVTEQPAYITLQAFMWIMYYGIPNNRPATWYHANIQNYVDPLLTARYISRDDQFMDKVNQWTNNWSPEKFGVIYVDVTNPRDPRLLVVLSRLHFGRGNQYSFPKGGRLYWDEPPIDAAYREFEEEAKIRTTSPCADEFVQRIPRPNSPDDRVRLYIVERTSGDKDHLEDMIKIKAPFKGSETVDKVRLYARDRSNRYQKSSFSRSQRNIYRPPPTQSFTTVTNDRQTTNNCSYNYNDIYQSSNITSDNAGTSRSKSCHNYLNLSRDDDDMNNGCHDSNLSCAYIDHTSAKPMVESHNCSVRPCKPSTSHQTYRTSANFFPQRSIKSDTKIPRYSIDGCSYDCFDEEEFPSDRSFCERSSLRSSRFGSISRSSTEIRSRQAGGSNLGSSRGGAPHGSGMRRQPIVDFSLGCNWVHYHEAIRVVDPFSEMEGRAWISIRQMYDQNTRYFRFQLDNFDYPYTTVPRRSDQCVFGRLFQEVVNNNYDWHNYVERLGIRTHSNVV